MALKAGRVGVAPSQVKSDGTLNIVIPDPPAPVASMKLYKKEFTLDKSKMNKATIVENTLYSYNTKPDEFSIAVTGYTPVSVKIIDRYTGYDFFGACLADNGNDGKVSINFACRFNGAPTDFAKAIVYYAKDSDIETLS